MTAKFIGPPEALPLTSHPSTRPITSSPIVEANVSPNPSPQELFSNISQKASHDAVTRSCISCHRRKVKCDKQVPCLQCVKTRSCCVFPGPSRARRRPRAKKPVSDRETELLKRLGKLECLVQELGGHPGELGAANPLAPPKQPPPQKDDEADGNESSNPMVVAIGEGSDTERPSIAASIGLGGSPPPKSASNLARRFERLVVDEGMSQYVSNPFWACVSDEVEQIREILDEGLESDRESPDLMNDVITESNHQSFIMGYSSSNVNLRGLHPLPSQIPFFWQKFLSNVNPLVKIIHIPTMEEITKQVQNNPDCLSRSMGALVFAIYFATITSMNPEEVQMSFGADKASLLNLYRFGVEQALARANFLSTNEIVTIQAFVLFLVCVRRREDARYVWSLTGFAIRIAQSLGLHRDGAQFGLSPFDTEMRRRLWWQICLLDLQASEDHGSDHLITDQSFDTELPLSINDSDLDPKAKEPPVARAGMSEMTLCLIRYEICALSQRLQCPSNNIEPSQHATRTMALEGKERLVKECVEHLHQRYLQYSEDAGLLHLIARLITAKMTLIIYHPLTQPGKPNNLSQDIRDRLFVASIEIIEYNRVLRSGQAGINQWGWLFHSYIPWQVIAYVLGELVARPQSDVVDRAWRVIDTVFADWDDVVRHGKSTGMLWTPMRKLMARARKKRQENMHAMDPSARLGVESTHVVAECQDPMSNLACFPNISVQVQPLKQSNDTVTHASEIFDDATMMPPQILGLAIPTTNPFQQENEQQQTPWLLDDSALLYLDMDAIDGDINWDGWNDLVMSGGF